VAVSPKVLSLSGNTLQLLRTGDRRVQIGVLLLVACAAVPKAGFLLGSIPLPIMYVALAGGLILLSRSRPNPLRVDPALIGLTIWSVVVAARLVFTAATLSEPVALMGWLLLPLTIVAISAARAMHGSVVVKSILLGVRLAAIYGFWQLTFGLEAVAVPGVTQAWGSDFADKHLGIYVDGVVTFTKIPSTYQNGNNFGVIAAMCFLIALTHPRLYRSQGWVIADLCLFSSAVLLSGSRSVLFGWIIGTVACLLYRDIVSRAQAVRIGAIVVVAVMVTLFLQPGLLDRFSLESLTDTSGSGRTEAWWDAIGAMRVGELAIGSTDWAGVDDSLRGGLVEGWAGATQQIGALGVFLLVVVWLRFVRPVRAGVALAIPLGVSAVLDSAYLAFPTLFLPAALIAGLIAVDAPQTPRSSTERWWKKRVEINVPSIRRLVDRTKLSRARLALARSDQQTSHAQTATRTSAVLPSQLDRRTRQVLPPSRQRGRC
jgi:hypothetical protein